MLKLLVALRNALVIIVLGWLGFSEKTADKKTSSDSSAGLSLLQNAR